MTDVRDTPAEVLQQDGGGPGRPGTAPAAATGQARSQWWDVWDQFKTHKGALVGALVFVTIVVGVFLVVTFDEIDQLVGFAPPAGFPRPVIVAWSGSHCRPLQPTRAVGSVRRRHGAGSHRHPDVSCSWAVLPPPRAAKSPVP